METTTHTPGTWMLNRVKARVDAPCGLPVCKLLWPTSKRTEVETKANGLLIETAPELLKAGKRVTNAFSVYGASKFFMDETRARQECEAAMLALDAAIAKATGRTG